MEEETKKSSPVGFNVQDLISGNLKCTSTIISNILFLTKKVFVL